MKTPILTLSTLLAAGALQAEVLLVEEFSYPNGELASVSGGTWEPVPFEGNENANLPIVDGAVFYEVIETVSSSEPDHTNGYYGTLFYEDPEQTVGNVVYAGVDIDVVDAPASNSGNNVLAFWAGSGDTNRARIWVRRSLLGEGDTAKDDFFQVGLTGGSGSSADVVWSTQDWQEGTQLRVVTQWDREAMTARLWVNPSTESDTPEIVATHDSGGSIRGYSIRHRDNVRLNTFTIDNLVVAKTFDEVLDVPSTTGDMWADWSMDEAGNVDTEDYLGWILVDGSWIYVWSVEGWFYQPEDYVTAQGGWSFIAR